MILHACQGYHQHVLTNLQIWVNAKDQIQMPADGLPIEEYIGEFEARVSFLGSSACARFGHRPGWCQQSWTICYPNSLASTSVLRQCFLADFVLDSNVKKHTKGLTTRFHNIYIYIYTPLYTYSISCVYMGSIGLCLSISFYLSLCLSNSMSMYLSISLYK